MPRKKLIRIDDKPYHVYNRVIDRKFYGLDIEEVWDVYQEAAALITFAFGARIHALVLMSNHYHMIVSTPDSNIDSIMRYFQAEISKDIRVKTKRQLYRFSGRYKWEIIKDEIQYFNTYRYLFRNPIEAKITTSVQEYKFSSLNGQLGESILRFPVYERTNVFLDTCLIKRLEFLNKSFE